MAFFGKAGSIIKQAVRSEHVTREMPASIPSVFQTIRCMSAKVFVGGLSYSTDEASLKETFAKYGEVEDARIINDRDTGNSRGFGFVTYQTSEEASSAIQALDGQDLHGRSIRVSHANERPPRTPGFGGGNSGYGGGGYGGGGNSGYGGGGYGGGGNSGYGGGGYGGGGNSGYGGGGGGGGGYGGGSNYGGGYGNEGNDSQNSGVTGTNYASSGTIGDIGSDSSNHIANAAAAYNPGVPGDFKDDDDDDEPENYANKRA